MPILETVGSIESLLHMPVGMDSSCGFGAQVCPTRSAPEPGERDFIKLADASAAMIWMARMDGHRTYSNQAWLEFRGRTQEQELGFGWAEGILLEDRDRCLREYAAACRVCLPFRTEYRTVGPNGICHQLQIFGRPWFEPAGPAGGYLGASAIVSKSEEQSRVAARELAMLSLRERQVVQLIARGYATKEAAAKLGISYKTADSHRSHVLKKLGMHETASVVRFAVRSGLIEA